jgi:hypothetical protein
MCGYYGLKTFVGDMLLQQFLIKSVTKMNNISTSA